MRPLVHTDVEAIRTLIRDIPDFPEPGILFRDITPLLAHGDALRQSVDALCDLVRAYQPDVVVGMESRGFIFAVPVAYCLGLGFVPVRKIGKLPWNTESVEYALEYGTNTLEIHRDALGPSQRVLIVDDLLATGGTVEATIELVERLGGTVVATAFLIELTALHGRDRLIGREVVSLLQL